MEPPCDIPLAAFVRDLASERPTPGSGSAAAVALALAAGCLGKAIAISLKHDGDRALVALGEEASALATAALAGLVEEAAAFRRQLQASPGAAQASATVAEGLLTCAAAVLDLAGRLRDEVDRIVAGDLLAAEALARAASRIVAANRAEIGER